MIQLVLAVQRLQIGKVLLEDVDVRLQERLSKSLEKLYEHMSVREGVTDTT